MNQLFLLLTVLVLTGCGFHKQNTQLTDPPKKLVSNKETNFDLLVINAVERGDTKELVRLIQKGAKLTALSEDGLNLLMMAVRSQQFATTEVLLKHDMNPREVIMNSATEETVDTFDFLPEDVQNDPISLLLKKLLNGEEADVEALSLAVFQSIDNLHPDNLIWLFEKGADPNFIKKKKTSPLIALFSMPGIKDEEFSKLEILFDILMSQPDIDVNLKVRRNTPLKKAKRRLKKNSQYQFLIDALIEQGAS